MDYHSIGPMATQQPAASGEIAPFVAAWRNIINSGFSEDGDAPLHWDESLESVYFTERINYDLYGALLVLAAHLERGSTPPKSYDGEWWSDEAYLEYSSPKNGQKYRPIVLSRLWLPGGFEFTFDFQTLTEVDIHICSNRLLHQSLSLLNETTFQISSCELNGDWADIGDEDATLRSLARRGFAIMWRMTKQSIEHHLPMILDD